MTQQQAAAFLFDLALRGMIIHRPSAEHSGWFEHGVHQVRADSMHTIPLASMLKHKYPHHFSFSK